MNSTRIRRITALAGLVTGKKTLVFVNSRTMAEQILQGAAGRIKNLHIHHSSVAPAKKKEAEEAFHGSEGACIICTGTLELGIDIGDLDIVVQVGPPDSVSSFLQRMGGAAAGIRLHLLHGSYPIPENFFPAVQ